MGQMLCPMQSVSVSLKVKELEQREDDIISHARPSPTVTGQEVKGSKSLVSPVEAPVCSPCRSALGWIQKKVEETTLGQKTRAEVLA